MTFEDIQPWQQAVHGPQFRFAMPALSRSRGRKKSRDRVVRLPAGPSRVVILPRMVSQVPEQQVETVVEVLCEAFYHYPVMRYVLGPEVGDFDRDFRRLVRLFVMARVFSADPLFGISDRDRLVAVATVTLPGSRVSSRLGDYREATWVKLPAGSRARYTAFCDACAQFDVDEPHHHLNMIGVRAAWQGKGLARHLIGHVIALADADPGSGGVSLSTESPSNVPLYEHLGFRLTGHAVVGPGLETWNFFRAGN